MPGVGSQVYYDTHFYCALCGGPFAQVFRTSVKSRTDDENTAANEYEDTNPNNAFNVCADDCRDIPEEVWEADMGYAAKRSRKLRRRGKGRKVRQAYDGELISTSQMKWTKNLRALIHRGARHHPEGHQQFLGPDESAYLTARGLIRQYDNWADAFLDPDEETEEEENSEENEFPVFRESDRVRDTFGFHVYQELGRTEFIISSIPFHDECWSLLDQAIDTAAKERGLRERNIGDGYIFGYLRNLVGISNEHKVKIPSQSILHSGDRGEVVTRLGEVDYREAQSSGEGWYWKHEEGCHWLAADPSMTSVREKPLLKASPNEISAFQSAQKQAAPRPALSDVLDLPKEIIVEICGYLSSTDIFSLRMASPAVENTAVPEKYYRRFLKEEFNYLPQLVREIDKYEQNMRDGKQPPTIDWRGSFEYLRKKMWVRSTMADPDAWRDVDIGLKNRNRIWKIVKPMADDMVETCYTAIHERYGAPLEFAKRTGIVRGYIGVKSGRAGVLESVYFGSKVDTIAEVTDEDESEREVEVTVDLLVTKIRMWTDNNGDLCGLAVFSTDDEDVGCVEVQRIGRRGVNFVDIEEVFERGIAGFVFCLRDGIISGAQAVFEDYSTSQLVGRWNGALRKILARSPWRKCVGLTCFTNTSGYIEAIALLEETQDVNVDQFGRLPPPQPTANLSQEVASVWRNATPPGDCFPMEREGPRLLDWRTCPADWHTWEARADMSKQRRPPRLYKIVGYYDELYLRGLKFVYIDGDRKRQHQILGIAEGPKKDRMYFEMKESIIATVISFGDAGIHGILFVTDRGRRSEVFGPRYLGTHKVFAPSPELVASESKSVSKSLTNHREELTRKIIGLHCIYDYEERKFLQLGLILPDGWDEENTVHQFELPQSIPFDEVDESGCWVDGPPPSNWLMGNRYQWYEDGGSSPYTVSFQDTDQFSGWVSVEGVDKVTIYGQMRGIRFSGPGRRDRFFGCVDNESDGAVQHIDLSNGERIIGCGIMKEDLCSARDKEDAASVFSASSGADYSGLIGRQFFLTNKNFDKVVGMECDSRVACPDFFAGLRYDFKCDKIVSWGPLMNPESLDPNGTNYRELQEMLIYPWKFANFNVAPDMQIQASQRVFSAFFNPGGAHLDALKGYVTSSGRFCGLGFRRNTKWVDPVFGHRSAYEVVWELQPNETIDALYLTEPTKALALTTNLGNTSPWFGSIKGAKKIKVTQNPSYKVACGIVGAVDRGCYDSEVKWSYLGLLYKPPPDGHDWVESMLRTRTQPRELLLSVPDPRNGYLPWFNDLSSQPKGLRYMPLVAQRSAEYSKRERFGRAFCVFDPSHLRQIRVYACTGRGIRSIRFRGSPESDIMTLGEWPDSEEVKLKKSQKMVVAGPEGERVVRLRAAFQRLDNEDRLIGLSVETSSGKIKTIVSSELLAERQINLTAGDSIKVLECSDAYEIVGLHGIVSSCNIHDIGLVTRKKQVLALQKSLELSQSKEHL